jgi:hypothetical protein
MRIMIFSLLLALASGGIARAQEAPPVAAPQLGIERTNQINRYQSLSHGLGIGGRVGLGVGIPLLVLGITLDVVGNVVGGGYLCADYGCGWGAVANAGYALTAIGVVALGGGITMLVLSNVYRGRAERLRAGQVALQLLPRLNVLAHSGHSDGVTAGWRFAF